MILPADVFVISGVTRISTSPVGAWVRTTSYVSSFGKPTASARASAPTSGKFTGNVNCSVSSLGPRLFTPAPNAPDEGVTVNVIVPSADRASRSAFVRSMLVATGDCCSPPVTNRFCTMTPSAFSARYSLFAFKSAIAETVRIPFPLGASALTSKSKVKTLGEKTVLF